MAEEALGLRRQRARQALEATSQRGPVRWEVPGGVVRTRDDRLAKSADRQGHHAVAGVCRTCRALGRARPTMLWSRDAQRPLPEGRPGPVGRDLLWRLPSAQRINQRRRHPCEAGALVSGRTDAKTVSVDGRARPSQRQTKPVAPWRMLLLDKPPGSSSWEDLLHTQQRWEAHRTRAQDGAGGAATRGPALRSGLRRGGRCGRKLTVASRGTPGRAPRDVGRGGRVERGSSSCVTSGGRRVDRAVEAAVVEALHPAGLHAAFAALEQVVAHQDMPRQALAVALAKAR